MADSTETSSSADRNHLAEKSANPDKQDKKQDTDGGKCEAEEAADHAQVDSKKNQVESRKTGTVENVV